MSIPKIPKIRIRKFNPEILETRRLKGSPPTIVVIGKRGSGKCMGKDTPLILSNGKIEKVQNIKVGDELMGDDSTFRTVLSITSGFGKMYKIKQMSGDDYIVNGDHILLLKVNESYEGKQIGDILEISVNDYLKLNNKKYLVGYKVPIIFPAKELPIDPYALGNMMGKSLDEHNLDLINNIHLLDVYKYNSRENQLKLLAGFLDIKGYYDVNCYNVAHVNYVLAKDIQFISRCLGFTSNITEHKEKCEGRCYKLCISGNGLEEIPCLNFEKKAKQNTNSIKNNLLTEIEIEELGPSEYYGFEIDGNQRFLLEDFTVTHNSTLITDLLWHMRLIPMFICMSGTEEGNGFYSKYMHPLLIHGEFKKDIVSNLIKSQKQKLKKCLKDGINPNTRPDLGVGLLLDDCGFNKKIMNDQDMRLLFMNGRHWKILFITSLQYMMGIPPDLRTNIDFVFCLRENIVANQKRLYDNFFGCFKKFAHFQEAFNECTNNYECMVLDNTSKSTTVEDCVFYYKAIPDRNYKLGSRELWNYLDQRCKKEDDSDSEDESDKIKSSVIVRKIPMAKIKDRSNE
jgi:hypothetical protein